MSESENKWSCEYCTYENFPSSLKCTMCRGPKPFVSEDIYALHDSDDKSVAAAGSCEKSKKNKWVCERCSYMNPSKENVCVQCGATNISAVNLHEHIQPLKISQNMDLAQSLSRSRNNSPPNSITSIENCKILTMGKWCCPMCTYENWPKSTKCAMCGTLPNITHKTSGASHNLSPSNHNLFDINNQDDLYRNSSNLIVDKISNNCENERKLRQLRRNADWKWLNACIGVIEGDPIPVEAYLTSGGDPARTLTASEVAILNRSSAFDVGHTLVHLAIRFQREDLLAVLLSQIEGSGSGVKRVPSYVAPDIAADIRRHFAASIRQRKGNFPCNFVTEFPTFALPAEVDELLCPIIH